MDAAGAPKSKSYSWAVSGFSSGGRCSGVGGEQEGGNGWAWRDLWILHLSSQTQRLSSLHQEKAQGITTSGPRHWGTAPHSGLSTCGVNHCGEGNLRAASALGPPQSWGGKGFMAPCLLFHHGRGCSRGQLERLWCSTSPVMRSYGVQHGQPLCLPPFQFHPPKSLLIVQ